MKFDLKDWTTGKIALTIEGDDWKVAFTAAIKAGIEFRWIDLKGKDFSWLTIKGGLLFQCLFDSGTKFYGTTFYGTKFYGTKFDGTTFYGTTFYGTTFYGTKFYGTKFDGTKFQKSTFNGKKIVECERPIFLIHPLGSDQHTLLAINTDKGIHIQTGCFNGSVDEFNAALKKKHGDNLHAQEYTAAIKLVELHFKLWAKK